MPELTCISCPIGCRITVIQDGQEIKVSGNQCRRGEAYAREETTDPKRIVTGVVAIRGSDKMLSVKTAAPVPKQKIFQVMAEIQSCRITTPVNTGQIIIENIAKTGVTLVATKNIYNDPNPAKEE